jgi:hypothetical protein
LLSPNSSRAENLAITNHTTDILTMDTLTSVDEGLLGAKAVGLGQDVMGWGICWVLGSLQAATK